jgi:hypothetical protein
VNRRGRDTKLSQRHVSRTAHCIFPSSSRAQDVSFISIAFAFGIRSRRDFVYFGFRHSATFFPSGVTGTRSDYLEQK